MTATARISDPRCVAVSANRFFRPAATGLTRTFPDRAVSGFNGRRSRVRPVACGWLRVASTQFSKGGRLPPPGKTGRLPPLEFMNAKRSLKVFLCHGSGDKPAVRRLYRYLVDQGIDAWLDEEKLLPGQDWNLEIAKAMDSADIIIVCLSRSSVDKEGYVQREIKAAIDKALEKPDGTVFIIPARLEECELPYRLSQYQWVDLFEADGREKLRQSLELRAADLGHAAAPAAAKRAKKTGRRKGSRKKPDPDQTISVQIDGNVEGGNIVIGSNNIVK